MSKSLQSRQIQSLVTPGGQLELSIASIDVPEPGPDDVIVRIEAAPINPSDLALLLGPADPATARVSGPSDAPVVTADIPEKLMGMVAGRSQPADCPGHGGDDA